MLGRVCIDPVGWANGVPDCTKVHIERSLSLSMRLSLRLSLGLILSLSLPVLQFPIPRVTCESARIQPWREGDVRCSTEGIPAVGGQI